MDTRGNQAGLATHRLPDVTVGFVEAGDTGELRAMEGDRCVGLLRGATVAGGFRVLEVRAEARAQARAVPALLAAAAGRFPGQRVEAVTGAGADDAALQAHLRAAGFVMVQERVHYGRSLADHRPAVPDPFHYLSCAELGRADLLALLELIMPADELARAATTAAERLDALVHAATLDGTADLSLWRVAYLGDRVAGVALAHVEPSSRRGSLLYLGVVPELRGRRAGARLHDAALAHLRAAGAVDYADMTEAGNAAMVAAFERNGCRASGASRLWVLRRPPVAPRLADFGALVAHMRAQGYAAAVKDERGWLATVARHGRDEAAIDLVWLRDLGLIQITHTFPFELFEGRLDALARAACAANCGLDVPGFVVDAETKTLRYQLTLLVEAGGVATSQLSRALAVAVRTVARSATGWRERASLSAADAAAWASHWAE